MRNDIHINRIPQLLTSAIEKMAQNMGVGIMMVNEQDTHALTLSRYHQNTPLKHSAKSPCYNTPLKSTLLKRSIKAQCSGTRILKPHVAVAGE